MASRRTFLAGTGITGLFGAAFRADALALAAGADKDAGQCKACELAANEDYWSAIARAFDIDRSVINFNNGGVCPTPAHVLEQMISMR
jgi:isopenicillin-N epimerase